MNDPERALQGAVLARLKGDAGVMAVLGSPARVYDQPPREPQEPYATLGRHESRPLADGELTEHRLTVSALSRYGGAEEAKAVAGAIRACLDGAGPEALDGCRLVDLRVTYTDVFRTSDLRWAQGLVRVRAVTEAAAA